MSRRPITIVMYHSVAAEVDRYTVSPGTFARQLRAIAERYEVIRLGDLDAVLAAPNGGRRVALTFDDALLDFHRHAFPVLEQLRLPSTVFVPTGHVGGHNAWDADVGGTRKDVMDVRHLRELAATGLVEFGSHTVDHVRMAAVPPDEMRRQARDSKAQLEEWLGAPVTMFAYPYGQLADFSHATTEVVADAGYRLAVTTHWGTRNAAHEALRLRRVYFNDADGARAVRRKVAGWYDWMGLKERLGYALRRAVGSRQ